MKDLTDKEAEIINNYMEDFKLANTKVNEALKAGLDMAGWMALMKTTENDLKFKQRIKKG